jgi:hypothetical protein
LSHFLYHNPYDFKLGPSVMEEVDASAGQQRGNGAETQEALPTTTPSTTSNRVTEDLSGAHLS